jgi:hypothetical protein
MKNIIGISAILAMVLFAGSALASQCTQTSDCIGYGSDYVCQNGACVQAPSTSGNAIVGCNANSCPSGYTCVSNVCELTTCGIIVTPTGNGLDFGTIVPGNSAYGNGPVEITNNGNAPAELYIMGADWTGPGTMPVGSTSWTITPWSPLTALTTSWADVGNEKSYPTDVYFQLTVPSPIMSGTYSQIITFGTAC